jgi:hypothetical protein
MRVIEAVAANWSIPSTHTLHFHSYLQDAILAQCVSDVESILLELYNIELM